VNIAPTYCSRQVCSRQDRGNGVAGAAGLRGAFRLIFFLRCAVAGAVCWHKDGDLSARLEHGVASLVLGSICSTQKNGFSACKLRFDVVVAFWVCRAPEGQLWRGALAVVGDVDGTTTGSQEWAWVVKVVEWCASAALV
jgi:hypothetical protein